MVNSMASKSTQPKRYALDAGDRTGAALAATIGLGVLGAAKIDRWDRLDQITDKQWAGLSAVDLTADQWSALDQWSGVLPVLRAKPLQTVYCCDTCGRWAVVGTHGSPPTSCNLTWACSGRTVKGSAPKKVEMSPWEPSADVVETRFAALSKQIAEARATVIAEVGALVKQRLDDRITDIKPTVQRDGWDGWPLVKPIFLDSGGVRVRVPRTDETAEAVGRITDLLASVPINPVLAKPDPWGRDVCKITASARKGDLDALAEATEKALDDYWDAAVVDRWNDAVIAHMADVAQTAWEVEATEFTVECPPDADAVQVTTVADDHERQRRDDHPAWAVLDTFAAALDPRVEDSVAIESETTDTFVLLPAD